MSRATALYFADIAKTTTVSDPQEERRLILLWQKHRDIKARDTIVQGHLRFVVAVARKRSKDPDRLSDLIAAGNIGLLKALDKYDLDRKPPTRFLTYAGWWVQKEIADEDYATSSLVHVPTHRQKAQRKQAREFQRALQEHGPEDSPPMDPGTPEGVTVSFGDPGTVEPSYSPSGSAACHDRLKMNATIRKLIDTLPIREQTVLNLYHGAKDEPRNLVQIAEIMTMSAERVRQIKIHGTKLLGEALARHGIKALADVY
jgi:RNA polymerase sigma factor (sigma-70 family)